MDLVWVILIAFSILVGVALAAATAVTFFLRLRAGEPLRVNLALMLRLYLYVAIIAGLLVFTQGASSLLRAGMATAWGEEFSYNPVFVSLPADRTPYVPHPLELRGTNTLTPEELEELSRIYAQREAERLEVEEERRQRGLERALDEGLIEGLSFTSIGLIVFLVHTAGQRFLRTGSEDEDSLHRLYLMGATVAFGLIAIVSLPQAVFETLRYALLDPVDEFAREYQPGGKLALSLTALPIWCTYLWLTLRAVRSRT